MLVSIAVNEKGLASPIVTSVCASTTDVDEHPGESFKTHEVTGHSVVWEWVKISENPVVTTKPVPTELYGIAGGLAKPASVKAVEQSRAF